MQRDTEYRIVIKQTKYRCDSLKDKTLKNCFASQNEMRENG